MTNAAFTAAANAVQKQQAAEIDRLKAEVDRKDRELLRARTGFFNHAGGMLTNGAASAHIDWIDAALSKDNRDGGKDG